MKMYILETLRETIWIWLIVAMDIILCVTNIIPIEIATDIVLFIFVSVIFGEIWDMSSSDKY